MNKSSTSPTSPHDSPVVDADKPWLGLAPYTEDTRQFFFGRDAEIRELFLRVRDNTLTVLFGMSGLGKTSLLGAGLVPKLRSEQFNPVLLRLQYEHAPELVSQAIFALASTCVVEGGADTLPFDRWTELTLWEIFHDTRLRGTSAAPSKRPVLIFDQFEEAFTLGPDNERQPEVDELFTQLADLIENRPPSNVQRQFDTDPTAALQYDFASAPVRVLITLREDYIAQLEARKCALPSLMRNRMALHELAGPQAKAAVLGPASLGDHSLVSDTVAEEIVCIVARRDVGTPMEEIKAVPPLLSLLCEQLNVARGAALQITDDLVRERHEDILDVFYRDSFFDAQGQPYPVAVRQYVEDTLVTTKGFRRTEPREEAESELGRLGVTMSAAVVQRLIDRRLLTTEQRGGIPMVEITHDRLVPFLVKSRNERRENMAKSLAMKQRRRVEKAEAMMELILEGLSPGLDRTQRTRLFETVRAYYEQLEGWESEAVESRSNQAVLFKLMGQAKHQDGDLEGARELYLGSLAIYQQLGSVGGSPSDAAAEVDRLVAQVREQVRTEQAGATFDIYISYSRQDNVPIPGDAHRGWITAIRDEIVADHQKFSTEPLRIFFDIQGITVGDDWRHRLLGALRNSKIMLVCLTPNYFSSQHCRWELEEYLKRQGQQLTGSDTLAIVNLVEVVGSHEGASANLLDEIMRYNFTDLRPWFSEGTGALRTDEVRSRMKRLCESIWERLQRARRAMTVPGNLPRQTPFFVGRGAELRRLHEQLATGAVGDIIVVQGLGGIGKTELAVAYACAWAYTYPVGTWYLAAEGKQELLPLIGELALDPRFGLVATEQEKSDPTQLGRGVLAHLKQRAEAVRDRDPDLRAACLLLLDNVTEPGLLSGRQLADIPKYSWLQVVATTRLDVSPYLDRLAILSIDALDEASAVSLIRELQPSRNARREVVTDLSEGRPDFISEEEEAAASEIVRLLGGFPLAVEQVALYLGLHPDVPPSAYLTTLRLKSLTAADTIPQDDANVADHMYNQSKQLGLILDTTLALLTPPARTALEFAALLPPDTVPWPWLRSLTVLQHSNLREKDVLGTDTWLSLQRQLTGLRLVTPGDDSDIGRVHSLVADHLSQSIETDTRVHFDQWIELRSNAVLHAQAVPTDWELDALYAALTHILSERPSRGLAASAVDLSELVNTYRSVSVAEPLLRCGHSVLERLAGDNPCDSTCQRDLTVSLNRLGDIEVTKGNLAGASRYFDASLAIRRHLAAVDASNTEWQRDLSVSLNNLAEIAIAQGNLAEAQRSLAESNAIAQRLAARDPGNSAWQRDVSVSHNKLGDLAMAQGDLAAAMRSYTEAQAIAERLAAGYPSNAELQRDLSVAFNRLADIAVAQGDLSNAQRQLFNSLAISERLAASDPSSAAWQRDLMVSLSKLGDVATAMGNLDDAQRHCEECNRINERLVAIDPGNAAWQRDLSVSYSKLGDLASALGDLDRAASHFQHCVAIAERLAAADPANVAWQRDLAVCYDRLGATSQGGGRNEEAEEWMLRSRAIKDRIAASDPSNAVWQRDLAATHLQLLRLAQEQRNQEKFEGHVHSSFAVLQQMRQSGLVLEPHMERLYHQLSEQISAGAATNTGPISGREVPHLSGQEP